MTEQQQRELLGEKLATFGLSPLETAVLAILGKHSPNNLSIHEIRKQLSLSKPLKKTHLRNRLRKMHKKLWITMVKEFPSKYNIVTKLQLQKNLEAIITASQLTFQTQKKQYRSILKLLQNIKTPAPSIRSKISIPTSSPAFLKSFIQEIATHNNLTLIKIETNMVIALRRENIFFRLNAVEFEYQQDDQTYNCGIIFCMVDDPALLVNTIAKIHQYNANGLKFSYKLEVKGYSDRKKRELSEYTVEPSSSSSSSQGKELLKSSISLVTPKKIHKGTIETIPLAKNPHYCVSIWKETVNPKPNLLIPVTELHNLKENDTVLK